MNDILLHVLAILYITALCAIIWILSHKDLKNEALQMLSIDDDDDIIRKCIKDSFTMHEMINSSNSSAELESFYWEIEEMDSTYRGLVPGELLKNHTNRLYDAISIRRDQMKKISV